MTSDLSSKIVQVEGRGRGGRVEFGTRTELEIRALVDPGPPPSLPHARTPLGAGGGVPFPREASSDPPHGHRL